jgi:hypothetical protein
VLFICDLQQQPVVADEDAVTALISGKRVIAAQTCTGNNVSLEFSTAGRSTRLDRLRLSLRYTQSYILMPSGSADGGAYVASAAVIHALRQVSASQLHHT